MTDKSIFALTYDFDKTFSPRNMQEYAFIDNIGMMPKNLWDECNEMMR